MCDFFLFFYLVVFIRNFNFSMLNILNDQNDKFWKNNLKKGKKYYYYKNL